MGHMVASRRPAASGSTVGAMQTNPEPLGPVDADIPATGASRSEEDVHTSAPSRRFTPPRFIGDIEVWAPAANAVVLVTDSPDTDGSPMTRVSDAPGWWRVNTQDGSDSGAPSESDTGRRYGFRILSDDTDGDAPVRPDPRSVRQPDGVHDMSALHVVDESIWTDDGWRGRSILGAIIYELHVGTFTPTGTLDAAIDKLDHLVDLGVDFVELMPVNAFNGDVGWGYDGVNWFAVQESYGGPDALVRFVDACHARGIGVVLDVVYNHLGPSGNYLPE